MRYVYWLLSKANKSIFFLAFLQLQLFPSRNASVILVKISKLLIIFCSHQLYDMMYGASIIFQAVERAGKHQIPAVSTPDSRTERHREVRLMTFTVS